MKIIHLVNTDLYDKNASTWGAKRVGWFLSAKRRVSFQGAGVEISLIRTPFFYSYQNNKAISFQNYENNT